MLRATQMSIAQQAVTANRLHFSAIARLQQQLSSGLRFEKFSDAPLAASRAETMQQTLARLRSDQAQLPVLERQLNESVATLLGVQEITVRARQIAQDAFNQNDPEASAILAREVDGLLERLQQLANTQIEGNHIFSGTRSDQAPISRLDSPYLEIPHVTYRGNAQRMSVALSTGISIDIGYSGQEIFFGSARQPTIFLGETGAAPGSGTDNGIGRARLEVTHSQTIYAGSSGIQPGVDSTAGDSIIGPLGAHSLEVVDTSGTGAAGTIALNGGSVVKFTSTDTNLEVRGPRGEIVYVDTTNITPGFSGSVDIESQGTLSTDSGQSTTAIDFSDNQIIRNSLTGQVTHVDSQGIHQTGSESVEYTGSADLFTALVELREDLLNTRSLGAGERADALTRRAQDIERISDQLLEIVGEQSISLENVETLQSRHANQEFELERVLADIRGVDLSAAATELRNRQTLVQASFASLSIVQSLNAIDFLR